MAEKRPVAENERVSYKGYFKTHDLYNVIDEWLSENWYDKKEVNHKESVHEKGKTIDIAMEPWKTVTDYMKYHFKIKIQLQDIKDVKVEHKTLQEGTVHITITSYLETDHEGRWQSNALFLLWNFLYDRYAYSSLTNKYIRGMRQDTNSLKNAIYSYLNFAKRSAK